MSFRAYLNVSVTDTSTIVYYNTTPIATFTIPGKITIIGTDYGITTNNLTFTDIANQYIDITGNLFSVRNKQSFDFRKLDRITDQKNNFNQFKAALNAVGNVNYLLIYINDLNDYYVEERILVYLETHFKITQLREKSTGSWAVLCKPESTSGFAFSLLHEKYDEYSDIQLYQLVQTELNYMNKNTWNNIFKDDFEPDTISNTYQTAFDNLDQLIKDTDSDFIQIMGKLKHHLSHPRDDNFDGKITDEELENPWYFIYPSQLSADMTAVRHAIKTSIRLAKSVGIDELEKRQGTIVHNTLNATKFLTIANLQAMIDYWSFYNELRKEFENKLAIT